MSWLRTAILLALLPAFSLPAATVRLLNGTTLEGTFEFDRNSLMIKQGEDSPVRVNPSDVLLANLRDTAESIDTYPPGVLLTDGSLVVGRFESMDATEVKLLKPASTLPLDKVAAIVFDPVPRSALAALPPGKMGAVLKNGDFFEGTFQGIDAKQALLTHPLFGPERLNMGDPLVALVIRDVKAAPTLYVVTARNGSSYPTDQLSISSSGVSVTTEILGQRTLDRNEFAGLSAGPARCQMLTDQKPSRVDVLQGADRATAYESIPAEATTENQAMLLTQSNAAITFPMFPRFNGLSTSVALPADAPPNARMTFAVYGDGLLLARSNPCAPGGVPVPFRVRIGNVKTVTLRMEPSSPTSPPAKGKWIMPMLLRQ